MNLPWFVRHTTVSRARDLHVFCCRTDVMFAQRRHADGLCVHCPFVVQRRYHAWSLSGARLHAPCAVWFSLICLSVGERVLLPARKRDAANGELDDANDADAIIGGDTSYIANASAAIAADARDNVAADVTKARLVVDTTKLSV